MAPRKRLPKNKGLEPNLYPNAKGGTTYFRYRHPVTKEWFPMGVDKAAAQAAARQLNARLMDGQDLVGSVMGTANQTMSKLIDRFRKEHLPTKKLAAGTLKIFEYRLGRIERDLGKDQVQSFDVEKCATYLDDNFERDAYVKHRGALVELFRFAIMKGLYRGDNPAEVTYAKSDYGKERQRLTVQQYQKIHEAAPEWLRCAMELSLITLQGRNEICGARFVDLSDGIWRVVRQKTEKNEWAHLEIEVTPAIEAVIQRARRSGVVSPFIIHRKPERKIKSEEKEHWTQVLPDLLSKTFKEVRDSAGLFDKMKPRERPTFHEIRALGAWLYEKQGFDRAGYVQQLMAHADEKMTEHYQSGHEKKWIRVRAELDLKKALSGS